MRSVKIIHFADLHLGVETYGRIDPASGLSSRLHDFLSAFDQLADYALANDVDLVLFCGDAYKSREPSPTQQREFARRINRLATGGIPVFLLVGNHDLPNAVSRATATEIFDTLAIKNVYVSSQPRVYRIPIRSGTVQIASLPWLRRSALLARDDTKNLTFEQINQRLQEILTGVIGSMVKELDPSLPSVLAAHVWVSGATVGSERSMAIGQEPVLLPGNIATRAFDYIALGHIHKHQVLSSNPPAIYSGSVARLDFGEENDEKGFYVVEIKPDASGRRLVSFEFHPVEGRRFLTIAVEVGDEELDPTAAILRSINEKRTELKEAIVRLQVSLPESAAGQLSDSELRSALREAHYLTIAASIRRHNRLRLGKLAAEEITPLDALKAYLKSNRVPEERAAILMEYGEKLMREQLGQV